MRAAIYTRVSSDPKLTNRSVEEQEAECRALCERQGWPVVRVFVDNDLSASRFAHKDRPAYAELADFLRGRRADVLVLWEASRAQRDLEDYVRLRNLCAEHQVLYSYSGKLYDLTRTDDRFTTGLDALLAERESSVTRDRVLRAFRANAAAGKPHGKLLYGYIRKYDDRGEFVEQVEHPEQADVVREASRRVSEGEACRSVALDFNARGILAPKGGTWDLTQIRRLATNPAYVGLRVHQGVIAGPAAWPAIVDGDTHRLCVDRMSDPRRKSQRDSSLKHLLSGAAKCGVCGGFMRVQKNRTHFAYLCKDAFHVSVKTTHIEELVTAVVIARMSRPDILELLRPAATGDEAAQAEEELKKKRQELEAFYDRAGDGGISAAGMARIEARMLPQIAELERLAHPTQIHPLLREMAGPNAAEAWESFSIGTQRQIVESLMTIRVHPTQQGARTFDPNRVEIKWRTD